MLTTARPTLRLTFFAATLLVAVGSVGSATALTPFASPPAGPQSGELATSQAASLACHGCSLGSFERRVIVGDIVQYSTVLQVGPGPHDRIGLHRVTREQRPYVPGRSRDAVFLGHGINVGFTGTFLSSVGPDGLDPSLNLPVFLAQNGVDVWGLDFRWALVPGDVEDISFMADWGLQKDADDLRLALSVARWTRLLTGSGWTRIDLLGYSRGGRIGYVYLNDETELPSWRRAVDRFIHLDSSFRATSEEARQAACEAIDPLQERIDAGDVAADNRFLGLIGRLTQAAPDDPSPVLPGFTNRQSALLVGTLPPGGSGTFHLFAGTFDSGLPTGLRYTQEAAAVNLLAQTAAFQPRAGIRDVLIVRCDDGRSGLDDRLAEITVPVLYIGAAGGGGRSGEATFPFLGSTLTESLFISLMEPGQELFDVGHGDILSMDDGESLVWRPILDWVIAK